jgi:sec-independent protein translocase protein TatC
MTEMSAVSIFDHIRELRKRIVKSVSVAVLGFVVAYVFYDAFIGWLLVPFENAGQTELIVTSVFEGFVAKMKFCALAGFVGTLPFHVYQLLRFVFPGLSVRERRVVLAAAISGGVLALLSLILSYTWLIPFTLSTMTSQDFVPEGVGVMLHFQQNIFYIINMMLYGMLAFQFPILLEVMLFFGWVTRRQLLSASRYVVVGILVVAAIVTPPDVISQCGIAIPLTLLYFLSILVAKIFGWGGE